MLPEIGDCSEGFVARITGIRLLTSVDALMALQIGELSEGSTAFMANKGLAPRVDSLVLLERRSVSEPFLTGLKGTGKWLNIVVSFHVFFVSLAGFHFDTALGARVYLSSLSLLNRGKVPRKVQVHVFNKGVFK